MSRNDGEDFAQRLYGRIPGRYRVLDEERGLPLLAAVESLIVNLGQGGFADQ